MTMITAEKTCTAWATKRMDALVGLGLIMIILARFLLVPTGARAGDAPVINPQPRIVIESPTIAVAAKTPAVDAREISAGDMCATVIFTVDFTAEGVSLYIEASDLYKGGDPDVARNISPISLDAGRAAEITVTAGGRARESIIQASWRGTGDPISNLPTRKTETIRMESTRRDENNQDVPCKICYVIPSKTKTAGQYTGKVKLTAFITP